MHKIATMLLAIASLAPAVTSADAQDRECGTPEQVKGWMKYEWWGSTYVEIEAGAETAAISAGVLSVAGERISPEGLYMIFIDATGAESRIFVFINGCSVDRIDVPSKMIKVWLARSRS